MKLRLLHLYDQYLNIYADRGNIAVLRQRCAWRGIELEVQGLAPGERFEPGSHDLVYVGGGQDRDQQMIAECMATDNGEALREVAGDGTVLLAVCGGYQLLGSEYIDVSGARQPGVGVLDLATRAGDTRLIGNIAISCSLPAIGGRAAFETVVVGFENHAGRTSLGASAEPLGRVLAGHGNDGESGFEGCRRGMVVGTYLHGPLLPRNPELADWLLAGAIAHAHGEDAVAKALPALDDRLAEQARNVAIARARAEKHAGRFLQGAQSGPK